MAKEITIDGKTVKLQIWDRGGQARPSKITNAYYRGAAGVIIVFDVTNRDVTNVETWFDSVSKYSTESPGVVLVGNKTDLTERQVTQKEAQCIAEKHGAPYAEVSVRDKININEPFVKLTEKLLQPKGSNILWWKKT